MKPSKKVLVLILCVIVALLGIAVFGIGDTVKGVQKMRFGIDIRGGVEAVFEPVGIERKATKGELDAARNVIETRLDANNITDREVTIDKNGGYIIVRFPWKSDETTFNPEEAIAELGEMARLTFRDPEGNVVLEGKNVISSSPAMMNTDISNTYAVKLEFDEEGTKLFADATEKLVGQKIAIYMDELLISDPIVNTKIPNGEAYIDHMESFDAAKSLSQKINAGALPFSLETTSFSTISPSLGSNALNIMVISGVIAFFLVCIFMIIIYKLPGVIACVVLLLQMVLQLLAISVPQYTLTLPGIAGVILSLGMAVDANIIISERITEEIGKGVTVRSAVINGYKNAFSSVLDGNVTTAIVAVILMFFGSGSMLSFGYTLLIGMIVNVFVGVTVSKKMLQCVLENPKWREERYFKRFKEKKMKHFYENWKLYLIISIGIFVIGIAGAIIKGVSLDTQFTGGVVLNYTEDGNIDTEEIMKAVAKVTTRPVTVQISKDFTTSKNSIMITLAGTGGIAPDDVAKITDAIKEIGGDASVELAQTYAVEPYIGAKALKNAGIAILLSTIFIVIYIWIRFSGLSAGVTATIALIHDVFVVFFTFVLFGIPLNDAFVAVVLTIIGYSINDTIVLYDRIRENKKARKAAGIVELVNLSITQTFNRSVNTSVTTGICVFIVLVASWIFRIESITEFTLPMFFGLISGCYSSICIAGIIWTAWNKKKDHHI